MDFDINTDQQNLIKTIKSFAQKELNNNIIDDDKSSRFPMEKWKKCHKMGLFSLPFPEKYGGLNQSFLTTCLCIQALGFSCKDSGLVHSIVTQIICGIQLNLFGSDLLKDKYLPGICSGETICAQAITEADSGSDALAMKTKAIKNTENYILNGTKMFITNEPIADLTIVFARTNPEAKSFGAISVFILEKDTPGFEKCKAMEKMGLRTLQNGELVLTECEVKASSRIGTEGQGAIIFSESMEWERILLSAANLGKMEHVLDLSITYSKNRKQFDQSICKYQAISNKISKMKVQCELSKLMLYKAAELKDHQKRASMESSMIKYAVSEYLKESCANSLQIHGANGYMTETEIERYFRDSIASTIYSGTSEMHLNIIGKLLGL
ncbi:MAG: acyl-CoA dehydrogenase family protein [Spirochaetaceae bacterium]|nr:acyl-CoA dehydrogenase family protein [Spirochaetaceae bacterium]